MDARRGSVNRLARFTKYEKLLVFLFLLTLPLSNPWVRGDGVGYYAFARSLLIEHRLDFTKGWLATRVIARAAPTRWETSCRTNTRRRDIWTTTFPSGRRFCGPRFSLSHTQASLCTTASAGRFQQTVSRSRIGWRWHWEPPCMVSWHC